MNQHGTTHARLTRRHVRERGLAMLVIIAILSTLFVMGWTLFLLVTLESRSGQNMNNSDRARADANAKLERATQVLLYSPRTHDSTTSPWYTFAAADADITIADLDARFNLNAMGNPADLGAQADFRQRFTSFENSLARLFLATIRTTNYDPAINATAHRRLCVRLAREIAERRYGTPRIPGDPFIPPQGHLTTIPRPGASGTDDFTLGHLWAPSTSPTWVQATHDGGVNFPSDSGDADELGCKDGYPSYWCAASWTGTGTQLTSYAEAQVWNTHDIADAWNDDIGIAPPNDATVFGYRDSIPSYLRNTAGTALFETSINYVAAQSVDEFAEYDPHHPVGDDRPYTSVHEIPAIIQHVLEKYEGMLPAAASTETDAIYRDIKDFICVHSHNRRAGVPSATGAPASAVSINDWSTDRIDNDNDGLVDEDDEGFTPQLLRRQLGLDALVGLGITQKQANQIVANLIDSRDADDEPTLVETVAGTPSADDAYGTEGLHVTEVMGIPDGYDQTANAGIEMVNPDDGANWEWNEDADNVWKNIDAGIQTGEFTFPFTHNGYYALRVYSNVQSQALDISLDSNKNGINDDAFYTVTCSRGAAGAWYGYVRTGTDLVAAEVWGQQLKFWIRGATGAKFMTIQLLPQYVEITNIAMRSPSVTGNQGINLAGYIIEMGGKTITLPAAPGGGKYYDTLAGAAAVTPWILPARGDGAFPGNYGHFVVAISEKAYALQNGTGEVWGDNTIENYPVYFLGDVSDASADLMDFSRANVGVTLKDSAGTLMAGGAVDAATGLNLTEYVAKEKRYLVFNAATPWEDSTNGAANDLLESQNWQLTVPAIRTNLNGRFDELYQTVGNLKTAAVLTSQGRVLPIVLNRPYASPAWMGLVTAGNDWYTINPDANGTLAGPEELLGRLMTNAVTGGDYARININTASVEVLQALFDDKTAERIVAVRGTGWASWDSLLSSPLFTDFSTTIGDEKVGYSGDLLEDSGAGSLLDDFPDDIDEKEEWFRRFGGQIDIRSSAFLITVTGKSDIPDESGTVAQARIEAVINRDGDITGDGVVDCGRVEYRYVTED